MENEEWRMTRRGFLKAAGALAGGLILAGCRSKKPTPTAGPPQAHVGIQRAASYEPKLVRQQVEALFDSLGGLSDVVKTGDTVAIKVNLTGGTSWLPPVGTTAIESYVTHPEVVRAMGELVRDAGARDLYIVEAVNDWSSFQQWGYVDMAAGIGATLIDLNSPQPYADFASVPVANGGFIYEKFTFNRILENIDVFVSVAKMKCHWLCGITQSMKNLVGLVPYQFYELTSGDGYRTGLHGTDAEVKSRLPRVVLDLNRARPIHISLIDGIKTVEGTEGPWNQGINPRSSGVLIGGKSPVATDAVAVAAMGFDPTADYPHVPFLRADNHLNLAYQSGMGTNRLEEIEILGARLDEVKMKFRPAYEL